MIRYSVQPRGQIFVNSYGFLSFAKIMGKDIATDVLASGTIKVTEVSTGWGNDSMEVVFENCTPFTNCIRQAKNMQTDNVKDIAIIVQNIRRFMAIL